MAYLIGRGRYTRESYPGPPTAASLAPAVANLELVAAILDNNVQHQGPVTSASATSVYLDSPAFTFLPSPVPGNATVDIKASMTVTGPLSDNIQFQLVRDRGTAAAQVLTTEEDRIGTSTGGPAATNCTVTLAFLDTNVGTYPVGFVPVTEGSTHTYSIVATDTNGGTITGITGVPAVIVLEQLPSGVTSSVPAVPGGAVALNSLLNFAAFAGAGISTTPGTVQTSISGSIGLGPGVTSTAFTGFGQTLSPLPPATSQYATSALVIPDGATVAPYIAGYTSPPADQGVLYASDYAVPTPANVNTSNNDLLTAYTDASGRPAPPANTDILAGVIPGGHAFVPGVYKWNSNVTFTGAITMNGAGVYIFIVTGTFDLEAAASIVLAAGATAANVFFAVAGATTFHAGSIAVGEFLAKTNIAMQNGATLTGRALAQTGITLIGNTLTEA
jgi:hypothetical protein